MMLLGIQPSDKVVVDYFSVFMHVTQFIFYSHMKNRLTSRQRKLCNCHLYMYLLYNALIYLCLGVLQAKGSQNYTASILFLILCFIWLKVIYICIYIYIFATQKSITGFEFTQVYIPLTQYLNHKWHFTKILGFDIDVYIILLQPITSGAKY